ncbi:MAG: thioredoxin-disulfide reductase [Candidatus Omnitrophota bacterium]
MEQGKKTPEDVYDTIIIGGGPAGLTAGLYAARARMNVLLIESLSVMGQATMTDMIENYPGVEKASGIELIDTFKKQAVSFGLSTGTGTVKSLSLSEKEGFPVWSVEDENGMREALSVIVATGAIPKKLEVPGEEEFLGKGISYCATCDAAFFREKDIVVVGGGDTAVEEALFLTRFGKKVTLIHRRDRLRAAKILQEKALSSEKMEFVWDTVVKEIAGSDKIEKVKLENVKTGEASELSCDGVFIFAGWRPNTDFLNGILKLSEKNCIVVDQEMKTSEKGVFACGDCCHKALHQVVTACGDGAIAANSAQQYVDELKGIAYR